jgi:hypothetical protein
MYIIETQISSLLYGCGASIRPQGPMPWMSAVMQRISSLYIIFVISMSVTASQRGSSKKDSGRVSIDLGEVS